MKSDPVRHNRIVIAGKFPSYSTASGVAAGFRQLGWDVSEVDLERFAGEATSTFQKIKSRILSRRSVAEYNREIVRRVEEFGPAMFLTVKGSYISARTLQKIRSLGALAVNYYPDFRFSYKDVDESTFDYYDRFFTTKSFQVDYLAKRIGGGNVEFLHHGYVSQVHFPPVNAEHLQYECDLCYIGNHTPGKEKWLREVKQKIPAISLKIYGHRWEQADELLRPSVAGVPLYGDDFCRTINTARINLAVHMGVVDNTGWEDFVSTRTFEIPACKGFMLHVDNREVRELFTPGEEIDLFSDIDELCTKIKFYLANDTLREEMVERAYQRCVPDYSYDERARTIATWGTGAQ